MRIPKNSLCSLAWGKVARGCHLRKLSYEIDITWIDNTSLFLHAVGVLGDEGFPGFGALAGEGFVALVEVA